MSLLSISFASNRIYDPTRYRLTQWSINLLCIFKIQKKKKYIITQKWLFLSIKQLILNDFISVLYFGEVRGSDVILVISVPYFNRVFGRFIYVFQIEIYLNTSKSGTSNRGGKRAGWLFRSVWSFPVAINFKTTSTDIQQNFDQNFLEPSIVTVSKQISKPVDVSYKTRSTFIKVTKAYFSYLSFFNNKNNKPWNFSSLIKITFVFESKSVMVTPDGSFVSNGISEEKKNKNFQFTTNKLNR